MDGRKAFLIFCTTLCCLAAGPSPTEASPADLLSPLRQALRRAVRAAAPALTDMQGRLEPAACNDNSECASNPTVCTDDPDLGIALCPLMCGACICEDSSTSLNCTQIAHEICQEDIASTLCAKTCGICGKGVVTCTDHVTGIQCSDLADPCNDILGQVACPKFCGLCTDGTSPPATTKMTTSAIKGPDSTCVPNPCLNNGVCNPTNTGYLFQCTCPSPYSGAICQDKPVPTTTPPPTTGKSCPNQLKDQQSLPCQEGEIVFLIEYASVDSTTSIDHEGDFIKELVDGWQITNAGIRFGVVVYHDTVTEAIHITDYKDDPRGLKTRISSLTRRLRPSGTADLAKALDFVRAESFKNSRPDAVKVVIPMIHQMSNSTKDGIAPAAQRLKDDCISIVGIAVGHPSLDYDVIHNAVSQPYANFYTFHRSFNDLENAGKWIHYYKPGCQSATP